MEVFIIKKLLSLIKDADSTIIFTGAGMSTESGLPDFRSKDRGLWEKFNPTELANVNAITTNKNEFIKFYQYRLSEIDQYQPHTGHKILAEWEKSKLIEGIITQNVDGFHTAAGSVNVMELHGSFKDLHCHDCHKNVSRTAYLSGKIQCECGGTIRPGIVLFGENLPQKTFQNAELATNKATLFIVLGSSLSVTPANMFPMLAKENGAKLVIVNREPTELDPFADLLIQNIQIKELLIQLNKYL